MASSERPGRWPVVSQQLKGKARRQRARARPWAVGLSEWCATEASDGDVMTLGSAVTLPNLGHMPLSSWDLKVETEKCQFYNGDGGSVESPRRLSY